MKFVYVFSKNLRKILASSVFLISLDNVLFWIAWYPFSVNMSMYRNSYFIDKLILWPFYLYYRNLYTDKTTHSYQNKALWMHGKEKKHQTFPYSHVPWGFMSQNTSKFTIPWNFSIIFLWSSNLKVILVWLVGIMDIYSHSVSSLSTGYC